jgi:hypothetical protein
MPTTSKPQSKYVIDCEGLAEVSKTTNNAIRSAIIGLLDSGLMRVPTAVYDELKEAFEDAAADLDPHFENCKIRMRARHRVAAAALAEQQGGTFRFDPYGGQSDLVAAAVAVSETYILVTTASKKADYAKFVSCHILTIEEVDGLS